MHMNISILVLLVLVDSAYSKHRLRGGDKDRHNAAIGGTTTPVHGENRKVIIGSDVEKIPRSTREKSLTSLEDADQEVQPSNLEDEEETLKIIPLQNEGTDDTLLFGMEEIFANANDESALNSMFGDTSINQNEDEEEDKEEENAKNDSHDYDDHDKEIGHDDDDDYYDDDDYDDDDHQDELIPTTKQIETISTSTSAQKSSPFEPTSSVGKDTDSPTSSPTKSPTSKPTKSPTTSPTSTPTKSPVKRAPEPRQKSPPTRAPTTPPTKHPTKAPTKPPTKAPTKPPTKAPTKPPTSEPTKTKDPSEIFDNLPEEEKEYIKKQEIVDEEKTAAKISLGFIFITLGLMICTAHQMGENPDGLYSNICRLAINITNCVCRIILLPFRKLFGFHNGGYAHHLVTTQEFRDPYATRTFL